MKTAYQPIRKTRGRPLIVADDMGTSLAVNTAIAECLSDGLVDYASIMANQDHSEGAAGLLRERDLLPRAGLHFVLTEGTPVSNEMKKCSRFCDKEGRFRSWRSARPLLALDSDERRAVYVE